MLSFALDLFLRSDGSPLISVISLVNIVLDYILVAHFQMGLAGATLATGISQTLACLLLLIPFLAGKTRFRFSFNELPVKKLGAMMANGSSEFLGETAGGLGVFLINSIFISRLGPLAVAAYSVVGYTAMIAHMCFSAVAQAISPATSYNYGAGKKKRISAFLKIALFSNLELGVIFTSLLLQPLPPQTMIPFIDSPPLSWSPGDMAVPLKL